MRNGRSKGFTLMELLIVVAIIGILVAIAIPSLLNAVDRGKQQRTMSEVRALGGAIQAYAVDNDIFPVASTMSTLVGVLQGDYVTRVKTTDAWGNTFVYTGVALDYTIGSPAKDGGSTLVVVGGGGKTSNFTDDIIYSKGTFVQWPEGSQD